MLFLRQTTIEVSNASRPFFYTSVSPPSPYSSFSRVCWFSVNEFSASIWSSIP